MQFFCISTGTRAILDSRQKALKLTANALYGFTGAMASPLQSVALADGCLALGSQVPNPTSTSPSRKKKKSCGGCMLVCQQSEQEMCNVMKQVMSRNRKG